MKTSANHSNRDITKALESYSNMVRRICYLYLKNNSDADDVFQEVFLALFRAPVQFESSEHEKAWIIRVTINKCKDYLKNFWYRNTDPLEHAKEQVFETEKENELMHVISSLPKKYKDVIYLFYYEDYTVPEISAMLKEKESTIYSQLHRARKLLKEKLGGTENEFHY